MHARSRLQLRGSSPHTRGARSGSFATRGSVRDHPRIRGEHVAWVVLSRPLRGSSPHTRGAPIRPPSRSRRRGDHPRIRGEHKIMPNLRRVSHGSSPHTRGAHSDPIASRNRGGIIPAYAGSTPTAAPASRSREDHPRIRGEHDSMTSSAILAFGSSPHTRGARGAGSAPGDAKGIIPAYAGSTPSRRAPMATVADHPRIRGEHGAGKCFPGSARGSSPHTRGALEMTLHKNGLVGIIPAYAGSTARPP